MKILIIASVIGMVIFMYACCVVAGRADKAEEKYWRDRRH